MNEINNKTQKYFNKKRFSIMIFLIGIALINICNLFLDDYSSMSIWDYIKIVSGIIAVIAGFIALIIIIADSKKSKNQP